MLAGYVVVLLSTNYIAEGDYWENEYYGLLVSSILGMVLMASARDLITIFVALELLSIPAYLLATWRKRDLKSNEAGMKYYLMGVFASSIMLYGMSLVYGGAGSTLLSDINEAAQRGETDPRPSSPSASSSWWSVSPSRSRPSRSTPGRPTPTRARPRRSPRSCRWRRKRPGSWADEPGRRRLPRPRRRLRAADVGPGRRVDDRGQPDRPAPDQHRPHARLLRCGPGRVHARAAGGGGRRCPTRRSPPSSPIW